MNVDLIGFVERATLSNSLDNQGSIDQLPDDFTTLTNSNVQCGADIQIFFNVVIVERVPRQQVGRYRADAIATELELHREVLEH